MNKRSLLVVLPILFCSFIFGKKQRHIPKAVIEEKPIVIITCSYNNAKWYKKNINSICRQQYGNFHVIYIDDCSSDGTFELVCDYVRKKGADHLFTLIHNETRMKALANIYNVVHTLDDDVIVALLDGDDFFATRKALSVVNKAYTPDIWMTYGQMIEWPNKGDGIKEIPKSIEEKNSFREEVRWPYFPSHLRTFKAGLFKKIKKEDLFYRGDFFPILYDLAIEFPLLEMSREGHIKFIDRPLVFYNMANPISDNKVNEALQRECEIEIRLRRKYEKLPMLS